MPFIVIIGAFFAVLYGWNLINNNFLEGKRSTQNDRAFLKIDTGSAKAMTVGGKEWVNAPNNIYLYGGESLKTGLDGRATLELFDDSVVRLNTNTEITLSKLSKRNNERHITINLKKGQLWVSAKGESKNNSTFFIATNDLRVSANDATFAISDPYTVYVIHNKVKVGIKNRGKQLKSFDLGVGQQLMAGNKAIKALTEGGNPEVIFAMNDTFKKSNWYRWNQKEDGALIGATEEDLVIAPSAVPTDELKTPIETTDKSTETANKIKEVTAEDILNDTVAPEKPIIKEPGKDGDTVDLKDIIQNITGSVSKDTEKVIVNDYTLGKYIAGSKNFRYTANYNFKNLKLGSNEYKIYAEDKAGNRSDPAIITLVLSQEVIDKKATKPKNDSAPAQDAQSTGGVTITSPNNGKSFSTSKTVFDIAGKVPKETVKVVVNDYTLQAFKQGDTSFTYKASAAFKNLDIGKINRYKVTAYNNDGDMIGYATISIDVESSSEIQITIPTNKSSYTTSLNELVLGGSVGKWVQKIFVNGKLLREYIPGSEEWKMSITLKPGINKFDVRSTKDNATIGTDSISITFKP